jgi:hypothetical protein
MELPRNKELSLLQVKIIINSVLDKVSELANDNYNFIKDNPDREVPNEFYKMCFYKGEVNAYQEVLRLLDRIENKKKIICDKIEQRRDTAFKMLEEDEYSEGVQMGLDMALDIVKESYKIN